MPCVQDFDVHVAIERGFAVRVGGTETLNTDTALTSTYGFHPTTSPFHITNVLTTYTRISATTNCTLTTTYDEKVPSRNGYHTGAIQVTAANDCEPGDCISMHFLDSRFDERGMRRFCYAPECAGPVAPVVIAESPPPPNAPPPPVSALCIDGYWPLYVTALAANAASPTSSSHTHALAGSNYYMPDGFTGSLHPTGGFATCPTHATLLSPSTPPPPLPPSPPPPYQNAATCDMTGPREDCGHSFEGQCTTPLGQNHSGADGVITAGKGCCWQDPPANGQVFACFRSPAPNAPPSGPPPSPPCTYETIGLMAETECQSIQTSDFATGTFSSSVPSETYAVIDYGYSCEAAGQLSMTSAECQNYATSIGIGGGFVDIGTERLDKPARCYTNNGGNLRFNANAAMETNSRCSTGYSKACICKSSTKWGYCGVTSATEEVSFTASKPVCNDGTSGVECLCPATYLPTPPPSPSPLPSPPPSPPSPPPPCDSTGVVDPLDFQYGSNQFGPGVHGKPSAFCVPTRSSGTNPDVPLNSAIVWCDKNDDTFEPLLYPRCAINCTTTHLAGSCSGLCRNSNCCPSLGFTCADSNYASMCLDCPSCSTREVNNGGACPGESFAFLAPTRHEQTCCFEAYAPAPPAS
jgi:hypothetical protein